MRSAEQPYGVRSAERGMRNGFTTRCYVHKDLFKCGMRSAE